MEREDGGRESFNRRVAREIAIHGCCIILVIGEDRFGRCYDQSMTILLYAVVSSAISLLKGPANMMIFKLGTSAVNFDVQVGRLSDSTAACNWQVDELMLQGHTNIARDKHR
jgi:hypothetical protein